MENKKISQLIGSFVMVPMLVLSAPASGLLTTRIEETPQARFLEKANTVTSQILAFNQSEEEVVNKEEAIRQMRADAIDAFFEKRKAPLAGYGMDMVLAAEKNDLPWQLLPALATIESNGGIQSCKKVTFSDFGWGSCNINFESRKKGIEIVAWNLGGHNPKTAQYYNKDKTLEEKLKRYNSVIPTYTKKVYKVMEMIGPENLGEVTETKTEA